MKKYNFFKVVLVAIIFSQMAVYSFAQTGESLDFDADNDMVYLHGDIDFNAGDWTVELWFNPGNSNQSCFLFSTNNNSYAGVYLALVDNIIKVYTNTDRTGWGGLVRSTGSSINRNWHHAAVVYESSPSSLKFYLDGTLVDNMIDPSLPASATTDPNRLFKNFVLGRHNGKLYKGKIDELRIWKTARTEIEIKATKDAPITNYSNADLMRYYNFDDGIPNGDNSSLTKLPNLASSGNIGASGIINYAQLAGFSLTGSSGNLVSGSPFYEYIISNSMGGECFEHWVHTGPGIQADEEDKLVGQTFQINGTGTGTETYTLEYLKTALYNSTSSVCDGPLNGSWANIQIYKVVKTEVEGSSPLTYQYAIGDLISSSFTGGRSLGTVQVQTGTHLTAGKPTSATEYIAYYNHSSLSSEAKVTLETNQLYAYVENSGGSVAHTYVASAGNPIDCTDCFAFHIVVDANSTFENNDTGIKVLNTGLPITPAIGLDLFFHLVAFKK